MIGVIKNYDNEMDKIEKIRAEIKRLITDPTLCSTTERKIGGHTALLKLVSFIDSLQQEQPEVDLEEAADKHIRKVVDAAGHPGWDWATQDIADAFIAGASWQKEQMLKDAVEGEAEELYNDGESQCVVSVGTYFKPGDEVYIIPKEEGK